MLILIPFLVQAQPEKSVFTSRQTDTVKTWISDSFKDSLAIFNIFKYGADTDSSTDDTPYIQAAIDAAQNASGGIVYISEGYVFKVTTDGTLYNVGANYKTPLLISESNITLEGGGTLYFPNWTRQKSPAESGYDVQAFIVIGDTAENVENVHIKNIKFLGTKDTSDRGWYGADVPTGCVQLGTSLNDYGVNYSGVQNCFFENLGGQGITQNGALGYEDSLIYNWGNYVINNVITNSAYSGINSSSSGSRDCIVAFNRIFNVDGGIEWAGMSGSISNNIIYNARNYGIAINGAQYDSLYVTVKDNELYYCGNSEEDSLYSSTIAVQDPTYNSYIIIEGNLIKNAYGQGISVVGGTSHNIDILRNKVDGFGFDAEGRTSGVPSLQMAGIVAGNYDNINVGYNWVKSLAGANDSCGYGILTGGGSSSDTWTDYNVVEGTFDIAGFGLASSLGDAGSGTNNIVGQNNINITTKKKYLGHNVAGNEALPLFTNGDTSPSVAGSDIWVTNNAGSTTITTFDDGYIGQEVTILFVDANTTISDNSNIDIYTDKLIPINSVLQFTYDGTNWKIEYDKSLEDSLAGNGFTMYSAIDDVSSFSVKSIHGESGAGESQTIMSNRYRDGYSSFGLFGFNMVLDDNAVLTFKRLNMGLSAWGTGGYILNSTYEDQSFYKIYHIDSNDSTVYFTIDNDGLVTLLNLSADTVTVDSINASKLGGRFAFVDTTIISFWLDTPTGTDNKFGLRIPYDFTVSRLDLVITSNGGANDSVAMNIKFSTDRSSGAPTSLLTSDEYVSSTVAGEEITTFNDATIPQDSWIWIITSAVVGTVNGLGIQIRGTYD